MENIQELAKAMVQNPYYKAAHPVDHWNAFSPFQDYMITDEGHLDPEIPPWSDFQHDIVLGIYKFVMLIYSLAHLPIPCTATNLAVYWQLRGVEEICRQYESLYSIQRFSPAYDLREVWLKHLSALKRGLSPRSLEDSLEFIQNGDLWLVVGMLRLPRSNQEVDAIRSREEGLRFASCRLQRQQIMPARPFQPSRLDTINHHSHQVDVERLSGATAAPTQNRMDVGQHSGAAAAATRPQVARRRKNGLIMTDWQYKLHRDAYKIQNQKKNRAKKRLQGKLAGALDFSGAT